MSAAEHKKYCAHYSKLPGGKQGRVAPEDAVKFLSKAKLDPERIRQLLASVSNGATSISRDHFSVAMHETYKAIKQKGGKTPAPSQMLVTPAPAPAPAPAPPAPIADFGDFGRAVLANLLSDAPCRAALYRRRPASRDRRSRDVGPGLRSRPTPAVGTSSRRRPRASWASARSWSARSGWAGAARAAATNPSAWLWTTATRSCRRASTRSSGGPRRTCLPPRAAPPRLPRRCLLYTSPSPRDKRQSRMPSSA